MAIGESILNEQTRARPAGGRARILEVARAAFVERGYADVSMQEIADAAGLTKAAIYYHFRDKEALFEAMLIDEIKRLCIGLEAQLALGPPLREQLERIACFVFETSRGDFGRLLEDAHRYCSRDRLGTIREQIESPYGMIREAFTQARKFGEIRDVDIDLTVALYLSMIGGQLKGAGIRAARETPPEVVAKAVAELVMQGIGDAGQES